MRIRNNVTSMNTGRNIGNTALLEGKCFERLASGYSINRSADDAAGLAISEKMRAQIRGLSRASRNALDGISLIQTAEGALQEVQNMLQRINELSVQASSDTNALMDRESLQQEVAQIISEVDMIASTTRFNDTILLDGRFSKTVATPKIIVPDLVFIDNIIMNAVEAEQSPMWSNNKNVIYDPLKTVLQEEIVPQAVTALLNTFDDTFGYLANSKIGIGLEIYDNPSSTTLAAVSLSTYADASVSPADVDLIYTLQVNVASLSFDVSNNNLTDESRIRFENTITHEMMHAMMMESLTAGMIGRDQNFATLSGGAFPMWFSEGTAQAAAGSSIEIPTWLRIDENSSEQDIRNALTTYNLTANNNRAHYGTGYLATMYLGYIAGGSTMSAAAIAQGLDLIMNDIRGGMSLSNAIANNTAYSGLSDFQNKFSNDGVTFTKDLLTASIGGVGGLVTGSLTDEDILADQTLSQTLFELNKDYEGVKNVYPDGYTVMSGGGATAAGVAGPDHPNAGIDGGGGGGGGYIPPPGGSVDTGGGGTGDGTGGGTGSGTGGTGGTGSGTGGGTAAAPVGGIVIQSGAEKGNNTSIFIENMNTAALGLSDVNISTRNGAENSIEKIRNAVDKISAQRAELGAMQNRFEYKVQNLDNTVENLQAAESNIRDTDMARMMSEAQKYQIIKQAGYAMLAQANALSNNVLSLLSV